MDLSRAVYSRDLKIADMRALTPVPASARLHGSINRVRACWNVSPNLLERWRGEWRAKGELAFPGMGGGADLLAA